MPVLKWREVAAMDGRMPAELTGVADLGGGCIAVIEGARNASLEKLYGWFRPLHPRLGARCRGHVLMTIRGVERLVAAGVQAGARFPLRLLADLTRDGDAYTHRGGVEFYEAEQFEFDFKESEESEALFPACAVTGSFDDLHLVAHDADGGTRVELLSPSARATLTGRVRLSVPLTILAPAALTTLESSGQLPTDSAAVAALRRWYAEGVSAEWERLRRERESRQQGFAFDVPGELKL